MIKYSPSTNGFYDTEIHGTNVPADVVEISGSIYDTLIAWQSKGYAIQPNSSGYPVVTSQKPYPFSKWDGDKWTSDTDKIKQHDQEQIKVKLRKIEQELSALAYTLFDILMDKGVIDFDDLTGDVKKLLKERDDIEGL